MRLLLDQDVWAVTARFLREAGHDIVTVSSIGHAQSDDSDLLALAQEQTASSSHATEISVNLFSSNKCASASSIFAYFHPRKLRFTKN